MSGAPAFADPLRALAPFAPALAILGLFLLLPAKAFRADRPRGWLAAGCAAIVGVYLLWRLGETAPAPDAGAFGRAFFHGVLVVELIGWTHAGLLLLTLSRRPDRTAETDAHAERLRARGREALPAVDALIPTYDESWEVLERTIVAARSVRWPESKLRVWVLDDGRRDWLAARARAKGVGYLVREGNAHAKAGNLNEAFRRTDAPFILVLDADFVAQPEILERMIGWFDDPNVGIVQAPQHFFNLDPLQSVPALRGALPGDQRFFFGEIMPGRDGFDCAFCCGSNGIIRRAALESIGGAMPTGSITEDVLLTLAMLRKGYVTRYVNERLAVGLAPESLAAFFVQRARWARGSIQTLYLRDGPLGPGLTLMQRLMFLPTHWVSGVLVTAVGVLAPLVSAPTGQGVFGAVSYGEGLAAALPAMIAIFGGLRLLAPGSYHPIAAMTLSILQSFRIGPTILWTLVRPYGARFVVTPKGRDARASGDAAASRIMHAIALATIVAVALPALAGRGGDAMAGAALSAVVSGLLVLAAAATSAAPPAFRKDERLACDEPALLRLAPEDAAAPARLIDLSLGGFCARRGEGAPPPLGAVLALDVVGVGRLAGRVAWRRDALFGCVAFDALYGEALRERLIRRIYCGGFALDEGDGSSPLSILRRMGLAIFRSSAPAAPPASFAPPTTAELRRARALPEETRAPNEIAASRRRFEADRAAESEAVRTSESAA